MIPIVLYGVVPLVGLVSFLALFTHMRAGAVPRAPVLEFFFLHVAYGGALLVLLTDRFWKWSGLASVGVAFLLFAAPPLALFQAWMLRRSQRLSPYHRTAAALSWIFPIAAAGVVLWAVKISAR